MDHVGAALYGKLGKKCCIARRWIPSRRCVSALRSYGPPPGQGGRGDKGTRCRPPPGWGCGGRNRVIGEEAEAVAVPLEAERYVVLLLVLLDGGASSAGRLDSGD